MNIISKGHLGMRRISTSLTCGLLAAVSLAGSMQVAQAATMRPLSSANERGIAADVLRARGDVRDLGRLNHNVPTSVGVILKLRNVGELGQLTLAQGNRRSPYYHHYLSNAQWNAYFAPTTETYRRVASDLIRAGFRIQQTFSNRSMIRATAPAGVAERYFQVDLHRALQVGRGYRYVNVTPGRIPAEMRDSVTSIAGLHNVVLMHFPIKFANQAHSARRFAPIRPQAIRERSPFAVPSSTATPVATATPKPITTSTPAALASPDATESPDVPIADYAEDVQLGYGPPIFADGYDFPVQHGYNGRGRSAGSVIDSDFSDNDNAIQYMTFGIKRTGSTTRVCTDPNGACTICTATATVAATAGCDPEGESTLDAQTIMSLDPGVNFYEYLVNSQESLDDLDVDAAYEKVVSDNIVEAVNSSFGDCETDDPSALYSENLIAEEGAAKGIMFSASTGDTGATSCGTYAMNGAPQSEINVAQPAAAPYFTGVGGTAFQMLTTCTGVKANCYTEEVGWSEGGGGVSVLIPQPSWQTALVAAGTDTTATGRALPDVAFEADIGENGGVPESVTYEGTTAGVGGTSLSSPMWVAMQTEIDQVQNSRNGFVNPRLYAIAAAGSAEYAFAFRDILTGDNVPYVAGPGYDEVTGIGSVLGWELAGTE